jgi:hypothetical protein
MYVLLSANCWAWLRAIILATGIPNNIKKVVMVDKDNLITEGELIAYLMTEYGTWGSIWCCVLQASYFHVITPGCYLNIIMI